MQHHTRRASVRSAGLNETRTREYCIRFSGRCSPTCVAADLSIPASRNVLSTGMDETGNGHTHRMAMACNEGRVWGTMATEDQSSALAAGTKSCSSEKSELSWRAATVMIVQKRNREDRYTLSAAADG
jgi:hypothetical protein